jgi:hypothetical protein
VVLGERLSWVAALGALLIAGGVVGIAADKKAQGHSGSGGGRNEGAEAGVEMGGAAFEPGGGGGAREQAGRVGSGAHLLEVAPLMPERPRNEPLSTQAQGAKPHRPALPGTPPNPPPPPIAPVRVLH